MSYTLDLIVQSLPEDNSKAWAEIETLRKAYYDDEREKAPSLIALHSELITRYPCLSSYADSDPGLDNCPWADGPMLNNFSHDMGMLAISFSKAPEVVPFIIEKANALGITVADGQSGDIYFPDSRVTHLYKKQKSWWQFWK